ncbi:MAG TPA: fused MFS/spermidine synthase [Gemmatimonadales bacterium]
MSAAPASAVPVYTTRTRGRALLVAACTAALFLNAALLFAVQPMFSKMALPLLGGAPAVWNTSMMVFQALLLCGYLYAHVVARNLAPARQVALHGALLVASLVSLPIALPGGWTPPASGTPVPWLVGLVVVGVGLPFFALSTAAPLVQQWFARTDHPDARDPYFLYAASNAGSLLALLAYPLLIEPMLAVSSQRRLWSWGYAAVAALVVACGVAAARRSSRAPASLPRVEPAGEGPTDHTATGYEAALASTVPTWAMRAWWTLLAFAPSSLLLGVTTYITTDVAAVPLLWVVPLALYLLSFVLVFARRPPLPHRLALRLQPLVLLPLTVALFSGQTGDLRTMAPLHLVVFFVTAMACHGELARLRPAAVHLTEFYLWLSVGGVLGGIFNVLVAPVLFERVLEYQIVLAVACALRPWPDGGGSRAALRRDVLLPVLLVATVVALLRLPRDWHPLVETRGVAVLGGLAALCCLLFVQRPLRLALGVLGIMMIGASGLTASRNVIHRERSFFGVYEVGDSGNGYHTLRHGTTLHGAQNIRPPWNRDPLTYYRVLGPLGDVFGVARLGDAPLRVAVVGLGTGSVACHARDGDRFTYYEIDPLVERLARDDRYFTYLRECTPDAPVVLGDARLSLDRGAGQEAYDLMVLDAFSSDAIPAHLLTREALAVYRERLAPQGVLAFHVSNRYLDLIPVLADLAGDAGMHAMAGVDRRITAAERRRLLTPSIWVAVARDSATLAPLTETARWAWLERDEGRRLWTDDYSNVLGVLRKR